MQTVMSTVPISRTPWELVIPADLAYGSDGAGDKVPPDQTLVFLINLAKVEYAP